MFITHISVKKALTWQVTICTTQDSAKCGVLLTEFMLRSVSKRLQLLF